MNTAYGDSFSRCEESIIYVQQHIDGLKISPASKRSHLAGGCLHASIEHGMAILVLVDKGLHGSALALARLQFEAYVRGSWLANSATDAEVDGAGRDRFPKIAVMIAGLEAKGTRKGSSLSGIKQQVWKALNSLTHTGYQQIGPRLTKDEIGSHFTDKQIREGLSWAEAMTILSAMEIAILANNDELPSALLALFQRA